MMGGMGLAASLLTLGLLAGSAGSAGRSAQEGPHRLQSPDGRIEVVVTVTEDAPPRWNIAFRGQPRVTDGRFGLTLEGGQELLDRARVESIKTTTTHDRFPLPFGKTSRVDQPWNEQRLTLRTPDGGAITLALRAYDDAFAFRYEIGALPGEQTLRIAAETTAFGLAPPRVVHASWLEHFRTSHEHPVRSTALDAIPDGQLLDTPLTVEFDDGAALAITEAALLRFAGMSLRLDATTGLLRAALSPRDDGFVARRRPLPADEQHQPQSLHLPADPAAWSVRLAARRRYARRIFSIGRPLASSSTSLSMIRIFCISGSAMASMRTPQMTPVTWAAFGWSAGAERKKASRSAPDRICFANPAGR